MLDYVTCSSRVSFCFVTVNVSAPPLCQYFWVFALLNQLLRTPASVCLLLDPQETQNAQHSLTMVLGLTLVWSQSTTKQPHCLPVGVAVYQLHHYGSMHFKTHTAFAPLLNI